ncbi:MAG TPA: EAL domain-containing protein [Polyangiaceae bacterium]|jgi:EAL domain-containing protein (putative c-di-GMP-specific phosphodiesterase class I)|nr:EAL domain-containing protein [Polyangiaceae bacterium]
MPWRKEAPIVGPISEVSGEHLTGDRPTSGDTLDPAQRPIALVVDDECALVDVTRRFLTKAGIDSVGCHDGLEALQVLRERHFDVIISDVSMPKMTGLELVRAIRGIDPSVPVIMTTGGPSVESAIEAIEHGVYRYLTKPVDPQRLIEITSRAIQLRQLSRAKEEALRELDGSKGVQSDKIGLAAVFESAMTSLWPAFQPIVSADGALFGYEALLRTDEASLPNPGAVLDAAERLNQLPKLFRTMRDRTCGIFAAGNHEWNLFLNLHPMDLNDLGLLDPKSLVYRCAKHIVLEVTERTTLDRVVDVRDRLARLRDVGYRIAIDDLGAGYAGLNSFATLEPEFVKFDMALVRDIHKNPVKRRLMRVMSGLCHDMGMQVLAEGIETVEERDAVLELGCDLLQGYLLGRPAREIVPRLS